MALLHNAELSPSKTELLDDWAPKQDWFVGEAGKPIERVAAFRFDDPAGKVGVETLLVRAGNGPLLQIPLTYREAPLEGGEGAFIGNMQHSVLGKRWVYDGAGDPVYLVTTADAALMGGEQATLRIEIDGKMVEREPSALVKGSGSSTTYCQTPTALNVSSHRDGRRTVVETPGFVLIVQRVLDGSNLHWPNSIQGAVSESALLTGTWEGESNPQDLVFAMRR
ncbi:MAG: hypothetical protein KF742_01205 [Cryobacterium sp.]|nr:hypothetical protein [Cryobacterium sp.]MBX3090694.1 hypothetical protein [Cryobacterium sp.]MCO5294084.1 hypothetical protein [Homoserinimonas sp.]MCW5944359.1 hypothetical protein [Cryobacterium sp.]